MGMSEIESLKNRIIDHYPGPWTRTKPPSVLYSFRGWEMPIQKHDNHTMIVACIYKSYQVSLPRSLNFEKQKYTGFIATVYGEHRIVKNRTVMADTLVSAQTPEGCAEKLRPIGEALESFRADVRALREREGYSSIEFSE